MSEKKIFKILSIDGGGIKGLYSATILEKMEEKYSCCTSDHFDMICGTSTGGLIALALSLKIPAKTISSFYMDNGSSIFKKTIFSKIKQIAWGGKYTEKELKNNLEEIFGNNTIANSNNLLCIPSYNYTDGSTCVFKYDHNLGDLGRDNNIKYIDIALATSAAPTYFPICDINNLSKQYIDGGVWANNPTLVGLIEALCYFVGDNKKYDAVQILSIASLEITEGNPIKKDKYLSIARWNKSLLTPFSTGQSCFVHNSIKLLQTHSDIDLEYLRIPITLISKKQEKHVGIDKANKSALKFIKGQGLSQADLWCNKSKLKNFFQTKKTYNLQSN